MLNINGVFCPTGCHLEPEGDNRFTKLKETHPKLYDYCMNKLGLQEFLDYVGEHIGKKLY